MGMMLAALSLALISACQSTAERVQEEGAVALTRTEVVALVSDRTEPWSKGAGYYGPDGSLHVRWKGESLTGTWQATDTGEICHKVQEWGSIPCTSYFRRGSEIVTVYDSHEKTAQPDAYLAGDQTMKF